MPRTSFPGAEPPANPNSCRISVCPVAQAFAAAAVSPEGGAATAVALVALLRERGWTLATAESCTGGGIAAAVTGVAGASDVFLGGVVSYANDVKADILGVPREMLARAGAVSAETAWAMAVGARRLLRAGVAVSATGIAGPGGATPGKPVGTVYMAVATPRGGFVHHAHWTHGDRAAVRAATVRHALEMLCRAARRLG